MAGETVKTEAICLAIRPWSRTSHIVRWLTPAGCVTTAVKGAVRPKSLFLGQYDLNYTCEIIYYAHERGELHALRECTPLALREGLRNDWRALALASHYRELVSTLAPAGPDCRAWRDLLVRALDALPVEGEAASVAALVGFELRALGLSGLTPDFTNYPQTAEWAAFSVEQGAFGDGGKHLLRISRPVAAYLRNPSPNEKNLQILLDSARVIGVFYTFHLDCAPETRRSVLRMICNKLSYQQGKAK